MTILRKPEHLWPAVWIGVVLALVAVIAAEVEFGRVRVGEGPRAPAKLVEAKLLPAFTLAPEGQSAPETVARPLFVPTRRPSPPAPTAAASAMKRGQFVLTGVTVTPDAAFAFLKDVASGKTQSARKGAQVGGMSIDVVEPRRVVLRQGEEIEELSLLVQVPGRVAAAAAPSAGVPPAPGMPAAPGVPGARAPTVLPSGIAVPGLSGQAGSALPPSAAQVGAMLGERMPAAAPGSTPPAPAVAPGTAPTTGRRRPWINNQ